MVHPGLNFIKQINSDKFDPKSFIVGHLEEFFKQLALYIQSLHKFDKKKDMIVPSKRINGLMIVNSLEKILPNTKQSDIPNSSSRDIDIIFSFLLHPDTPAEVRIPSSNLFKNFAKKLDDNTLSQLNQAFYFLIPLSRLARNEEECQNIVKNYSKNVCGLNSGGNPISFEEAYSEVVSSLQFIIDLYILRNAKSPIQYLFNDIFPTIYFKQIQSIGYQNKKEGGFESPSPSRLQNEILKFFDHLRQSKCNLLPFGDTKEKIAILLTIMADSSGKNGEENAEITFTVMNIFTQEPLFGNFKIQSQIYSLIDTVFNLLKSFSPSVKKVASTKASLFLSNLMNSEFISMNGEDLALNVLTYVYQKSLNESQVILAQDSALLFVINNKINSQLIWDMIIKQIKTSPIAAIATCRFSMYIATLDVPLFYKFDVKETIEACLNISFRSKRNRLKNNYDFVAEYIGLACQDPAKFVSTCLEIGFEPLAQYISHFEDYPFPDIRNVPNTIEDVKTLKEFFLPRFSIFNFNSLNEDEQNNLFSITFTYYYTILRLHRLPPEIKFDKKAFFFNYGNTLIKFCLQTNLPSHLKLPVFSILSEAINDRLLLNVLNSSILTHWYMILYLNILSNNDELSEAAFISATKTLRIGFTGSSILVPLLLYSLENGLDSKLMNMKPEEKRDRTTSLIDKKIGCVLKPVVEENTSGIRVVVANKNSHISKYLKDRNGDLANPVVGFLSMAPLFQHRINVPQSFLDFVKQRCSADPNYFNQKYTVIIDQILTEKVDYKSDVIKCLKMFENNCCAVTASSVLIVNELVKDQPDTEFIASLIDNYIDPIVQNHSVETLNCLMGMMDYFKQLGNICKESILKLISAFTEETIKITSDDQPDWIYAAIITLMTLLIHTYSISKETKNAEKFCQFLTNFSSQQNMTQKVHENLILLSQNSLDMMSVYYGCYPFPNTPLFPSNMNLSQEKDKFYYIGHHTLIHASTNSENKDEIRIDIITEVGKFSYSFKPILNKLLSDEKVNEVDIPITSEKEESSIIEKNYIDEVTMPPNAVISEYEEKERSGNQFPLDLIDDEDNEIKRNISEINESLENMKYGKLERSRIRPFSSSSKQFSGFTPLSILNIITSKNKENVKKIDNTKASAVLLNKIENHSHRIRMKIGVVYVGKNKEDQDDIFSTKLEDTSNQFKEFLNGLGYAVSLSSHSMHNGGLDLKGGRSGKTSIYYADFSSEIMFHVGPLLPTVENDSQQVLKKRHIGNDHIYIVYVDNNHDYNPSTISSQFGMMQIIVYPNGNSGLYRVEIYSRENEVPYFGPLRNGTIVQKKALPSLVRSTAIVTMMNFWCQQKEFFHPTIELAAMIDELMNKHAVKDDCEAYKSIEELLSIRPS